MFPTDGKASLTFLQGRVQVGTIHATEYGILKKANGDVSLYEVDHHLLFNMHPRTYTKQGSGRIDDATAGQFSDSRNHVSEMCMDSIQAYVGNQHLMLLVGIRSCDILFSHRDEKVRASILLIIFNFASRASSPSSHQQSDMNTMLSVFASLRPFFFLSLSVSLSIH